MLVSDFDFDLPERLIATHPLSDRETAKLLAIPALSDRTIADLPELLPQNSIVVINDTKVIPARIVGTASDKQFEFTLHKELGEDRWLSLAKNSRKLNIGDTIIFSKKLEAKLIAKHPDGDLELQFNLPREAFFAELSNIGEMPLPPYIKRAANAQDKEDYQTVYADKEGAAAAPTAGLHLTENILARLAGKAIEIVKITLHVGAGTFLPVKSSDTRDHKMHSEFGIISPAAAAKINAAKSSGKKIVAIGTTSLRLLESATDEAGHIMPFNAETDIFITPGYRFKAVDILFTNFHTPKSTLFMLVCAFGGTTQLKKAYAHAIANEYRFYSYGDATLIKRAQC